MPESGNGTVQYRLQEIERRLKALEAANILVLADRVARLSTLVGWMIGLFATFILTTLGGIIVYLVSRSSP